MSWVVAFPEAWDQMSAILVASFAIVGPLFVLTEFKGMQLSYSKFASYGAGLDSKATIPSRVAMTVIYGVAFIAACFVSLFEPTHGFLAGAVGWPQQIPELSERTVLVARLNVVHFLKRLVEVHVVHLYSGTTGVITMFYISFSYLLSAFGTIWGTEMVPATARADQAVPIGIAVFVIGEMSNLYHHLLLRWMRTNRQAGGKTKYVVPHGGLFEFAACPHYALELVGWLGLCIVSQGILSWTVWFAFTCYLSTRSYKTSAWYHAKMEGYPKERKHMVPFVW